MDVEEKTDKDFNVGNTMDKTLEEIQSEPANNATDVEDEAKSKNTSEETADSKIDNVSSTQESKNDEDQDDFYDAENAIIQGSQELKEKVTPEESEVEDVFMSPDHRDSSVKTSQNEELVESVIDLNQTEVSEKISQTNQSVDMDFGDDDEDVIALDQTDEILVHEETHKMQQAENVANSSSAEENVNEDTLKLDEIESLEEASHIVISDVSTTLEEAETEISEMADNSNAAEHDELKAEENNLNDLETFKSTNEENTIFDKLKDEKNVNDIQNDAMGIDDPEQANEKENLSVVSQNDKEKEAQDIDALETKVVTENKLTPDIFASETDENEEEEEDILPVEAEINELENKKDELELEKEEEKQNVSISTENVSELEMDFEENSTLENFADKPKKTCTSKLDESMDLFASESDDLENLTAPQTGSQATENQDMEPEDATMRESTLIESQPDIVETEKKQDEQLEANQEDEAQGVPIVSDTEIVKAIENLDLAGVENNKNNSIALQSNIAQIDGDKNEQREAENIIEAEKSPVAPLKAEDTESSKEQETMAAVHKKTTEEDDGQVMAESEQSATLNVENEQQDANKNIKDASVAVEPENVTEENKIENVMTCTVENDKLQTENKDDSKEQAANSECNGNLPKEIDENKENPMEVDAQETNVKESKECDLTESATVANKEIFVFQQKVCLEKQPVEAVQSNLPKLDEVVPVIEIDDDDELPKAEKNIQKVDSQVKYPKVKKQCINIDCTNEQSEYYPVTLAVLQFYKIAKKFNKKQFICENCYAKAIHKYEEYSDVLKSKLPLYSHEDLEKIPDSVEIIDSSDEEDNAERQPPKSVPGDFSLSTLDFIEQELENTIKNVFDMVDIQKQLKWCKSMQSRRLKLIDKRNEENNAELNRIQQEADAMQATIYQYPKITIRTLQPLDLNDMDSSNSIYSPTKLAQYLPPIGEIVRPGIKINSMYYAVKNKPIASWVPCTVLETVENKFLPLYKIKYLYSQHQMVKTVSAKYLAYYEAPEVRLPIGSRVIAYFDVAQLHRGREKVNSIHSAFYPGIIAEPMRVNNNYRYLIFYDDGYTQYVKHEDVRLVCHASDNVWEDIHQNSREFIKKYLMQYAINRPMVQTQKGQTMQTESDGKWMYARVIDIDCSLVLMQFDGPKTHTEWIYRGSARLGPVFKEFQKNKDSGTFSRLTRRTEPFIRYTIDEETTMVEQREEQQKLKVQQQQQQLQQLEQEKQQQIQRPPTAKKSTSLPQAQLQSQQQQQAASTNKTPTVRHLNNSTIYLEDDTVPKGKTIFYMTKRDLPPTKYSKHKCSRSCRTKVSHSLAVFNPLSKPLITGWERMLMRQKSKIVVVYRGPCGKIMRNIKEVHLYLRATESIWNVEHFDFSPEINCLAEFVIESAKLKKPDISMGKEKMPIPLVNCYDNTLPPECEYSAQRIPTEGVNLNLDEEFLVGCDCEDDCSDKSKCSCWKLTLAGAKYGNPNTPIDEVGYQYKRLYEHVPTGIYECNSRCKCKSSCLNRVVQQSLQLKLEVFKTSNRGWGLRCLNDVPRGSFVCIYAGHLLTEAKANEGGIDAGDEYFAELDYIEVAEQIKEGYENDVESLELEEEEEEIFVPEGDDDDDEFRPSKAFVKRNRNKTRPLRQIDDDSLERQVINFNPNADMNENSIRESSMRSLFGKDEACYIMDAKITGNLGRYFNHSCAPNLFVQNVFVDTHDLRFPWVAFFASSNIRSGTELTWNYNYEVGVVPGKVLYCQCGAPNCRVRLL